MPTAKEVAPDITPVDACPYKLRGYDEHIQCLEGKHIAFIGDSLTRFQYLSLVYYLYTGRWTHNYPSSFCGHHWPSKGDWMIGSSLRTGCMELCDCLPAPNGPVRRENRYFRESGQAYGLSEVETACCSTVTVLVDARGGLRRGGGQSTSIAKE